jgi:hypothetical protein
LLRVQSQQLPTESQVLEDEVLPGTENAYQPTEEMPERHDHSRNYIGKVRSELCAKSFILKVYDVLARHNLNSTDSAVDSLIQGNLVNPAVLHVAISAKLAIAKFSLLSCGVVAGLAFGFLGFALFLIGVRGDMDVKANNASAGIQIARIAPGAFVMLCAALLIGLAVTHNIDFSASGEYSLTPKAQPTNPYSPPEVGKDRKP